MTTSAAAAVRTERWLEEAAPFVKWAGGKGRLLSQLRPLLPSGVEHMRHVEPFVGGGALFFARRPKRALLTDINPELVASYDAIRDEVEGVIQALRALAGRHSKERYYRVREQYNRGQRAPSSTRAAMFIYLNKTCFNGLHRVNRKGQFNVPLGSYKNPRILNEDALRAASQALQGAQLRCAPFEALLESAKPGDFIYFDPPYEPVSPTASFTAYARDGFSTGDQSRLRNVYGELDRRGCKLMLSNSDSPIIRNLYAGFHISTVAAPRAINCDATKRGKVAEIVVRNYT
jgi:DNA adenine methylase